MSFSCFDNSNYDYNALVNKPCVNGCILSGDMSFEDMGLTELVQQYTLQYAEECIYPTVDNCLATKQDCLTPGLGICLCSDNTIQVAGDSSLDTASENVIKNCAVTNAVCDIYDCITNGLNTKQDKLCEGRAICITGNCIAVKVDNFMDCTSTNPVANCVINQAIDCIMSCGYQAGNGITMTTDECGCHVVSLADCVNVVCDLSVAGCTSLNGTLTVFGDIYQCGSTYCTHAEEVYSCHDCIYLRDGATSPLATGDKSGFVALKYNGTANAILAVDSTGTWRLGETDGDPNQVIATRAETCNTENKALAVWNCTSQCFDTTHSCDNQFLTWDDTCIVSLQNSLNSNHTKLKGEITNADTVTIHDYDSFAHLEADIQNQGREFSRYDNVAGVACTFCMTNIFKYAQCGCCVDYSTLCEGPISCAQECLRIEIPLNGDVPTIKCSTACPDAATKYAYDFYDNANTKIVSLYSQENELYNELECYVVTDTNCTTMLKKQYCYIPNKTGSMIDGCYSANDLTSDPSYCNLCTVQLCYKIDDLGIFCNDCTYYCYDAVSLGYCCIALDEGSYIPATYYFQQEDSYTQASCFDLVYNCGASNCAVCGDCFIQLSTNCQSVCDFRIYRSLTLGQATDSCCYNATCTEVTYTCCYPITAINACVYENNYRLQIEESGNGRDYLVHSYGLPGNYLEQCRVHCGEVAMRNCCYCTNGGCWTNWYSTRQMIFDTAHPIGDKYIQYPYEDDPNTLYNKNGVVSKWQDISNHFAGLFMRFAGGNAVKFEKTLNAKASGTTVTFETTSHGIGMANLIVDPNTWEQREVTAINGANVTIKSAFTSSQNITNVLILQNDTIQGHKHNDSGHRHQLSMKFFTSTSSCDVVVSTGRYAGSQKCTEIGYANIGLPTKYNDSYGQPRLSFETRAKNMTVRLWKRIN